MPFSERLPLFPLGIVLCPDEPIPLHIFEPRYREMVRVCLDNDQPFGIVYVTEEGHARIGCTARIRRVLNRYDDGRLDIVVMGEERFRLLEIYRDKPYLSVDAEPYAPDDTEPADAEARTRVITQHMKLLELAGETINPAVYEQARHISFMVAKNAGLELADKQAVLEMPHEQERVHFLIEHFTAILKKLETSRELRHRAQGDGHATGFPEL